MTTARRILRLLGHPRSLPSSLLFQARRLAKDVTNHLRARVIRLGARRPSIASDMVLHRLRTDPAWTPQPNIEFATHLERRLRAMEDPEGSNRWLHQRWIMLFEEMWSRIDGRFQPREGFHYVLMGAGSCNPLAFAVLMFMAGAGRIYAVEPDLSDEGEGWRITWGLQEMVLRILSGNISSPRFRRSTSDLRNLVDLDALLHHQPLPEVLGNGPLTFIRARFEDSRIPAHSVDVLSSRSVLEHVVNPKACFAAFASILKPGAVMYHDIGLAAHSLEDTFKFYYTGPAHEHLNELRFSDHVIRLKEAGFDVEVLARAMEHGYLLDRSRLQERFQRYSEEDLRCSGAVLFCRKQPSTLSS